MEIQFEDMTIGFIRNLSFRTMTSGSGHPGCSLTKMKTRDGSSFVITYSYVDGLSRTFDDRAEAFYIDGINEKNKEKAAQLFEAVYNDLVRRYNEDRTQTIDMQELVENVKAEVTKKMGL